MKNRAIALCVLMGALCACDEDEATAEPAETPEVAAESEATSAPEVQTAVEYDVARAEGEEGGPYAGTFRHAYVLIEDPDETERLGELILRSSPAADPCSAMDLPDTRSPGGNDIIAEYPLDPLAEGEHSEKDHLSLSLEVPTGTVGAGGRVDAATVAIQTVGDERVIGEVKNLRAAGSWGRATLSGPFAATIHVCAR